MKQTHSLLLYLFNSYFISRSMKQIASKINYNNFDSIGFLKNPSSYSENFKRYNETSQTSHETDIEIEEISDQLSSILLQNEQIILNKTGRLPNNKPRWPITTTREKHNDNAVFLARANNPFGHSTKWKYR